jgi:hypothetical protein
VAANQPDPLVQIQYPPVLPPYEFWYQRPVFLPGASPCHKGAVSFGGPCLSQDHRLRVTVLRVKATFEIKPMDSLDVVAVYEALAHRRSATHSYVLLHVPKSMTEQQQEAISQIEAKARNHGIGAIKATVPDDYES